VRAAPQTLIAGWLLLAALALSLAGCGSRPTGGPERAEAARQLFLNTVSNLHLPSALAAPAERRRLQEEAAASYARLLKEYPEQDLYAAQACRNLGNLHAARTNLAEAVRCYREVGTRYAAQEWEVVQAWKSAGDLLWEAGRPAEAIPFYRQLVSRFDQTNQPAVIRLVVKGARSRLP
jgi:tetratricopeptide (TPR) repeat protein